MNDVKYSSSSKTGATRNRAFSQKLYLKGVMQKNEEEETAVARETERERERKRVVGWKWMKDT